MKVIITKNQSDTLTSTTSDGTSFPPSSHSSVAVGFDDEMKAHKKERLKNLKVIQEKANVKSYGGNQKHITNMGRPLRPTMRKQHR